jgi:hypothetical protein
MSGSTKAIAAYDRAIGHLVRLQSRCAQGCPRGDERPAVCVGTALRAYLSLRSTEGSGSTAVEGHPRDDAVVRIVPPRESLPNGHRACDCPGTCRAPATRSPPYRVPARPMRAARRTSNRLSHWGCDEPARPDGSQSRRMGEAAIAGSGFFTRAQPSRFSSRSTASRSSSGRRSPKTA